MLVLFEVHIRCRLRVFKVNVRYIFGSYLSGVMLVVFQVHIPCSIDSILSTDQV